jgi:predicted DNA-binding ArsR family transcriptional regulator
MSENQVRQEFEELKRRMKEMETVIRYLRRKLRNTN